MLRMYMSEKMQPGLDCCYAAEKFFRTVMDIVVKVEDDERRCVGMRISVSSGIFA